jgi:hypothetical protein
VGQAQPEEVKMDVSSMEEKLNEAKVLLMIE